MRQGFRLSSFFLLVVLWVAHGYTAERLAVRAARRLSPEGKEYGRIVFDWPTYTAYQAQMSPRRLLISFGNHLPGLKKGGSNVYAVITRQLSRYITAITRPTSKSIAFSLARPLTLQESRIGTRIVLDLYPKQLSAAQEIQKKGPVLRVTLKRDKKKLRLMFSRFMPHTLFLQKERATLRFTSAVRFSLPSAPLNALNIETRERSISFSRLQGSRVEESRRSGAGFFLDIFLPSRAPSHPFMPTLPLRVFLRRQETRLQFPWKEATGAAVFRRKGQLWVLFDRPSRVVLPKLSGVPFLQRITPTPKPGATLLLLRLSPGTRASVQLKDPVWTLVLSKKQPPPHAIEVNQTRGGKAFVNTNFPGKVIPLSTPEGKLLVGTMRRSGRGILSLQKTPLWTLLPSVQGVVVQPLGDAVNFKPIVGGFVLDSQDVAPAPPAKSKKPQGRLFNFRAWQGRQKTFDSRRVALLERVVRRPLAERTQPQLDLARFYLSWGLAAHAKGILDLIQARQVKPTRSPSFRALYGAAQLLLHRPSAAYDLFSSLSGKEARLWQAASLSREGHWDQANTLFQTSDSLLADYPPPLLARLGLLRLQAALKSGHLGPAHQWLQRLSDVPLSRNEAHTLRYFRALTSSRDGDNDEALALWRSLLHVRDSLNQARAQYALLSSAVDHKTLPTDQAIKDLRTLHHLWRGDALERKMLSLLGRLFLENKNYWGLLKTQSTLIDHFPRSSEVIKQRALIKKAVEEVFFEKKQPMPPLEQYSLYNTYQDILPQKERIKPLLAERLEEVGYFSQATVLFENLLSNMLAGPKKGELGVRLADLHLMDGQPHKALRALDRTRALTLPPFLARKRARLRAQAYIALRKDEKALGELAGDISPKANLLRLKIYRQNKRWNDVASVLQHMAGPPPKKGAALSRDRQKAILDWAVALRLAQDKRGLDLVRARYSFALKQGPFAHLLSFILSTDTPPPRGLGKAIEKFSQENKDFDRFLKDYKKAYPGSG